MRLDHTFTVPVPVDQAWDVLLDVPRIAPCMPGAALTDFDGESFNGTVKVKLGPIQLTYKGKGRFVERDEAARRVVIEASGRDVRAAGTAAATVTAVLLADGDSTRVDVATELTVTGKPAQFGRGMLADVSGKLLGQFADCLAGKLADSPSTSAAAGSPSAPAAAAGLPTAPGSPTASAAAPDPPSPSAPADSNPSPADSTASPAPAASASGTAAAASGSAGSASETAASGSAASTPVGSAAAATVPPAEVEPIDLLKVTGISGAARRYAPYALGAVVLGALVWLVIRSLR